MKYCGLVIDEWCFEHEDKIKLFGMLVECEASTIESRLMKGLSMQDPYDYEEELEVPEQGTGCAGDRL